MKLPKLIHVHHKIICPMGHEISLFKGGSGGWFFKYAVITMIAIYFI